MDRAATGANMAWQVIAVGYTQQDGATAFTAKIHVASNQPGWARYQNAAGLFNDCLDQAQFNFNL
ncbi:MAG: hypothetical protein Q7U80_09515 [Thiobacillus sp.]|nr:hypothetical protein [Thiobacillus sp.]MDP3125484.1 hypothetical protein [Thiobacillus sp.]